MYTIDLIFSCFFSSDVEGLRPSSMAASSLCNFLSFLLPSQQTKKPPSTQLVISSLSSSSSSSDPLPLPLPLPTISSSSSSSTSFQSHLGRNRDGFVAVMANEFSSSSNNDFLSVVFPSLAYSNTLFFKSAYNVQIIVGEDEPEEALLRRFRREVMRAGVITECKRRRFFENKQEEKKRRTREAAKRNRRRRSSWRQQPTKDKQEASSSNDKDKDDKNEEEDNWELPEGDLPY